MNKKCYNVREKNWTEETKDFFLLIKVGRSTNILDDTVQIQLSGPIYQNHVSVPAAGLSLMGESGHGVRCQADGWRVNGSSKHLSNTCNVSSIVLFWVFLPVQYWQHVISSVLLQCPCRKGNWGTQKLRTRSKLTHIVRVENRIWIQAVRLLNLHF